MIFIANVLAMNGGTTFLVRICREFYRRGVPVAVLVLFPIIDATLSSELSQYARVIHLRDFLWDRGRVLRAQMMTFAPVRWARLLGELRSYGGNIHVMGVFGLLFASRLKKRDPSVKISAGIYHQNEFLFRSGGSFFVRTVRRCFCALSPKQILFFNEIGVKHYGLFFKIDYSSSEIVPIGIELPRREETSSSEAKVARLVSIGNLVSFKTYNRHIIEVISKLSKKHPELRYEIYGSGPERAVLEELSRALGVEDRVDFKGQIPYSEFSKTVSQAKVFIGSGTALLEAAALGVPAMVGIESFPKPETYGFLSDIRGFSYNEYIPDLPRFQMLDLIDGLLVNGSWAKEVAHACREKAAEFSIASTANGFKRVFENHLHNGLELTSFQTLLVFLSFAWVAFLDRLGISSDFRNRRDQSY